MSSTRNLAIALCGTFCVAGCEVKKTPAPAAVSHAPLVIDEAMQNRQWPMSVAQYQNGSTPAFQTASLVTHRSDAPAWAATVTDTPIFLVNSITAPIVFCFSPPWTRVIYPRGGVEPSYTAQPPLKPMPIRVPIGNAALAAQPQQ